MHSLFNDSGFKGQHLLSIPMSHQELGKSFEVFLSLVKYPVLQTWAPLLKKIHSFEIYLSNISVELRKCVSGEKKILLLCAKLDGLSKTLSVQLTWSENDQK